MPAHKGTNKVRKIFTCTKNQDEFIKKLSKQLQISESAVIRRLLRQNIGVLIARANMTQEEEEQLQHIIKIAKTSWLDDDNEMDY